MAKVKEYIEREASLIRIRRLMKQITPIEESRDMFFHDSGINGAITGALLEVENIPAADVVEVVRCKDCKYYGWEQEPCHGRVERFCKLHKGLVAVNKETFCSYGERKNDATS